MQSWENLEKFTLGSSIRFTAVTYIDEFILMKNNTMADADCLMQENENRQGVTALTDEASGKAFVTAVKNASSGFTYPGQAWNAYSKVIGASPGHHLDTERKSAFDRAFGYPELHGR